jgi:hypothetical protein
MTQSGHEAPGRNGSHMEIKSTPEKREGNDIKYNPYLIIFYE